MIKLLKRFWDYISHEKIIYEGYEGNEHHVYRQMSIKTKLSIFITAVFLLLLFIRWITGSLEKIPANIFIGGMTAFIIVTVLTPTTLYLLPIKIIDSLKLKTKLITFGPVILFTVTLITGLSLIAVIILMDAYYF